MAEMAVSRGKVWKRNQGQADYTDLTDILETYVGILYFMHAQVT